jgi:predicted phosphohydrolase
MAAWIEQVAVLDGLTINGDISWALTERPARPR